MCLAARGGEGEGEGRRGDLFQKRGAARKRLAKLWRQKQALAETFKQKAGEMLFRFEPFGIPDKTFGGWHLLLQPPRPKIYRLW